MKYLFSDLPPRYFKNQTRPRIFFAEQIDTDGTRKVFRFASKAWRDEWANRPGLPVIRRAISAKRGRLGFSEPVIGR